MVTKRWKLVDYINSDHEELYDLRNDPHELTNLMVGGWQSLRYMPAWQQTWSATCAGRCTTCSGAKRPAADCDTARS